MPRPVTTRLPKGHVVSYERLPPNLLAGRLCLDFVNTVSYRGLPPHQRGDRLVSYSELVAWAGYAGAIGEATAKALLRRAAKMPEQAARVLQEAIILRETIAALAVSRVAGSSELSYMNERLAQVPPVALARRDDGTIGIDQSAEAADLRAPLWPILRDAADFLISSQKSLVRVCANEECGWVFLDLSRTQNRRWCSMRSCGNRDKVSRHYHRTASERPAG